MDGIARALSRLSKQFESCMSERVRIVSTRTLIPRTTPEADFNLKLWGRKISEFGTASTGIHSGFSYIPKSADAAFRGQNVSHLFCFGGSDCGRLRALFESADGFAVDHWREISKLLFSNLGGAVQVTRKPLWVDIVFRVAEVAKSSQCKPPNWTFSPTRNETSVSESYWANVIAGDEFFAIPFANEDPFLAAGKTPDDWVASCDTIFRDSLFALDWLADNWPTAAANEATEPTSGVQVAPQKNEANKKKLDDDELKKKIEICTDKQNLSWRELEAEHDVSERTVRRWAKTIEYDLESHKFVSPSARVSALLDEQKKTKKKSPTKKG